MQARSLLTATLLHGAIVVGIGLGVHPWLAQPEAPAQVAVIPTHPERAVPEEVPLLEDVAQPPETTDADFVEPDFTPPPAPTPDEDAEEELEEEDRDIPDPVYSAPQRFRACPELLIRIRPAVVEEKPEVAVPAVACSFVEATVLDDHNKPPVYPAEARRRGVQGEVILLVTVDARGHVSKVDILKSAGLTALHRQLDRAAIAAICKWRYAPAKRDGVPVGAKIKVPVEFQLR